MKPRCHYVLLVISTILVFALIFLSFQFNWIDQAAQCVVTNPHQEESSRITGSKNGIKPEVLLILGAAALMAGGVLWSFVNYKKDL